MLIPFSTKRIQKVAHSSGFRPNFSLGKWAQWDDHSGVKLSHLQFLGSSPPDEVAIFHAEPIGGVLEHPGHRHS